MRNPFKPGDKVVRVPQWCTDTWSGCEKRVCTVKYAKPGMHSTLLLEDGPPSKYPDFDGYWDSSLFRAAIAGQDYDVPTKRTDVYQGHLPDGSSVQAHSAGGLYPFVLVWRDKRNGPDAHGKYDVGVLGPTNQEPIWCPCSDHAIKLAEAIKEYKL